MGMMCAMMGWSRRGQPFGNHLDFPRPAFISQQAPARRWRRFRHSQSFLLQHIGFCRREASTRVRGIFAVERHVETLSRICAVLDRSLWTMVRFARYCAAGLKRALVKIKARIGTTRVVPLIQTPPNWSFQHSKATLSARVKPARYFETGSLNAGLIHLNKRTSRAGCGSWWKTSSTQQNSKLEPLTDIRPPSASLAADL